MPALKRLAIGLVALLLAGLVAVLLWSGWIVASTRQDEVAIQSGALTLRGTLLSPRFGKDAPGVVLVHGSGQTSRKSTMLYAWVFASQGYAALAYDKRGIGASQGDRNAWRDFSFEDLASDAAAGYRLLQARPGVDPKRVGFFGASQGGWVVSLAANRVDPPAFLILASASYSTVAEDRLYGRAAQMRHAGFGPSAVRQAVALMQLDHEVTRTGRGFASLQGAWTRARTEAWFQAAEIPAAPLPVGDPHRLWERTVLDFDPRPHLAKLDAPVLWIFGDADLDRFSPVALSLSRIRAGAASGRPCQVLQINNVGHTLELEGDQDVRTLLTVRLPMIYRIFAWLESDVWTGKS